MRKRIIYTALCGCMLLSVWVQAQFIFTGPGTNWGNPANWSGALLPPNPLAPGQTIAINSNCNVNINYRINTGGTLTIATGVTLSVNTGRNFVLFGTITTIGTGSLINNGTLRNRGNIISTTMPVINNGTMSGDGTIVGNLNNNGAMDLGIGAIWNFNIIGDYTAAPGASHILEIRNNAAGTNPQSDRILVTGIATINSSTLTLIIDNQFEVEPGDMFMPISANGGLVGTFLAPITLPGMFTDWTITYNTTNLQLAYSGAPLPIELVSFEGKRLEKTIRLFWQTATEKDNAYMSVERSADGQRFIEIGRVKGAGTTLAPQYYQFVDEEPLSGINYYRLKQVDSNEKIIYHHVIVIKFDLPIEGSILYPTATDGTLNLLSEKTFDADSQVLITNMAGRILLNTHLRQESNQEQFDVRTLASGQYLLILRNNHAIQTFRFVKL